MATVEKLGKYEIRRLLGRGAMGTVHEGWDPIIERRVAIKTVKLPDSEDPETEEALARFRREAQAAGRLQHPNIVGVFDYVETDDVAYIVMEFIDGPSLKSLLDKQERFTIANIVRIMSDMLAGLSFSHGRGVVHRDIKPANVMLTADGQAKIADFGIARIESSSMTQAGTVLGTPAYMSPEQIMGQVVDSRTDIYSAGVVLYQLLTGERPFEGGMSAIMHKALNTEPPLPSQIAVTSPTPFDSVVRKAMAKRPEDRFGNASEFAAAIRDAAAGRSAVAEEHDQESTIVAPRLMAATPPITSDTSVPGSPAISTMVAPPPKPAKKSALPLIVVSTLLVLMAAGGGAYYYFTRPPPPKPDVVEPPKPQPDVVIPPKPQPNVVEPPKPKPDVVEPPKPRPDVVEPPKPEPPKPQPFVLDPTSPANLEALRAQIAQLIATQKCGAISGNLGPTGAAILTGTAAPPTPDELRFALSGLSIPGGIDWRVVGVDPMFCPVLQSLQPMMHPFGGKTPGLALSLVGGRTTLKDGEQIRPRLVMADFPGALRLDLVVHDGTVLHLYPQVADKEHDLAADEIGHIFSAREVLDKLGIDTKGHPPWLAGTPYGVDMIIAIQSGEPLFDKPRPSNAEPIADYLRDLNAATTAARARGVRLIGNVLHLETVAK